MPASAAARAISVFLTTAKLASASRSERRSAVISDTVRPRYSVSNRAADPSIRCFNSATRSSFSVLGIAPPHHMNKAPPQTAETRARACRRSRCLGRCPVGIVRVAPLLSAARSGYGPRRTVGNAAPPGWGSSQVASLKTDLGSVESLNDDRGGRGPRSACPTCATGRDGAEEVERTVASEMDEIVAEFLAESTESL